MNFCIHSIKKEHLVVHSITEEIRESHVSDKLIFQIKRRGKTKKQKKMNKTENNKKKKNLKEKNYYYLRDTKLLDF